MVVRRRACVVLQEQVQVANLVKKDWTVDDAGSVDLVKLLNGEVLLEIKAEHRVKLLAVRAQSPDQKDLRGGNLKACEPADWRWDNDVHFDHALLANVQLFDCVERP